MYDKDWKKAKLCIGLCNNQDKINSSFFWNFIELAKPSNYIVVRGDSSVKSSSLNTIARIAWDKGSEKILFLDIDQEFQFDTIPKLLSRKVPIISGVYHTKKYPYSPVMGWKKKGKYVNSAGQNWKFSYAPLPDNDDQLIEVDWAGIGCLLVDMKVFDKIRFPAFRDTYNSETGERKKGHDIIFCDSVKKAGFKIYADNTVQCTHRGTMGVNDLFVDTYYASGMHRKEMEVAKAGAQNKLYWNERHFADRVQGLQRKYTGEFNTIGKYVKNNSSVADMGCGPGFFMEWLRDNKRCKCYGYDFSAFAISEVKDKGLDGEVADFRTFKPNGEMFDYVVSTHALEHMVDDEGYLRTCASMLKSKDGKVIVSVPSKDNAYTAAVEHQRTYTKASLTAVMKRVFKKVSVQMSHKSTDKEAQKVTAKTFVAIGSQPHGN